MNRLYKLTLFLLLLVFLIRVESGYCQLRVSKLFTDGMVLQRDKEVPVWGWAERGEKITVSLNGRVFNTRTAKNGSWMLKLPPMPAGGPFELRINGKKDEFLIEDILVGDVWICSGQSNMEWTVGNSKNAEEEITNSLDTGIRHFKVPRSAAREPEPELAGGEWKMAIPENTGQFTAVGYYFAKELRKHVDVPIGLLNTSWGGSRLEPWMSAEVLGDPPIDSIFQQIEFEKAERLNKFKAQFGEVSGEDQGMKNGDAIWAQPDLDESNWKTEVLPETWENAGYEGLDGIGWYRRTINLSTEEAQNELELGLGKIDDSDMVWLNRVKIGGLNQQWNTARVYMVEASVLKPGENVIAIRVEDTGGGGGIHGEPELMYMKSSEGTSSLSGKWKFRIGAFKATIPVFYNQIPTLLYNKMIHPLLNYPIKGVIWYQGESNAGNREDAMNYRNLFANMIEDWRTRWNSGNFPFLFVQLANFMDPDIEPVESNWAFLRESQSATLSVPNTAQAVIIDIGEAGDIHPKNKQDVGYRLSLAARRFAYGEELVYSGPVYKDHRIDGNKVEIEFDHVGSGLWVKDKYGYVKGFAVSGNDGNFVWARARQEGNKIIVWNDEIEDPVVVRYAWGNNPDDVNLYNLEGLPASPFRTDK